MEAKEKPILTTNSLILVDHILHILQISLVL